MKLICRVFALCIAFAVLFSFVGCTGLTPKSSTLAGGGYFTDYEDDYTDYAQMKPGTLTLEEVERDCARLLSAAEFSNSKGVELYTDKLLDALYTLDTDVALWSIENRRKTGDAETVKNYAAATERYTEVYDAVFTAFRAAAESASAGSFKDCIGEWLFEAALSYDPESQLAVDSLSAREWDLEREYEVMSIAEIPDEEAIAELFVELVGVRNQIAEKYGYDSYADYAYDSYVRAYTPEDAEMIWKVAKNSVIPLRDDCNARILEAADALENASLDCSEKRVLSALSYGAERISPEVRRACEYMLKCHLYDIAASDEKADTGFTTWLSDYSVPYLFNSPSGSFYDYSDVFHEFGHFLSYYYNLSDAVFGYADFDLSELQSQGMEVLYLYFYDAFFGELADDARVSLLGSLLYSVIDGAMFDEFQQRVYETPELTVEKACAIYAEVYEAYGYLPYDGYTYEWTENMHNFTHPFYYISYAVSALPALELYGMLADDPHAAADAYLRIVAMDPEIYYLYEALEEAGLSDVFADGYGETLVRMLVKNGVFD